MSAISNSLTTQQPDSSDAFSALGSQQFLKIIFTEMTNQDPLAPNETKDLLAQLSTLRSIESDIALQKNLKDILQQNQISSAGALIGKFVFGRDQFNEEAAGYVASVSITPDGPVLNLNNGFSVPLDRAEEIIDPDLISGLTGDRTGQPTTPTTPTPTTPTDPIDPDITPVDPTPTDPIPTNPIPTDPSLIGRQSIPVPVA
jgi:flagellar basal-body rod modification protein FlgD